MCITQPCPEKFCYPVIRLKARSNRKRYFPPPNSNATHQIRSEESGGDQIEDDPDVEDIESQEICKDNKATCINDNIDGVLEVFDETTCRDMLIGYYEVASKDRR